PVAPQQQQPQQPVQQEAQPQQPAAAATGAVDSAASDSSTPGESVAAAEQRGAAGLDTTELRRIWPELLEQVSQRHKPTLVLLQNATLRSVEGNTLVLAMPTAGLARQLDQESRTRHIVAAMHQLFGGDWTVRCVHGDDGGAVTDGPPSEPPEPPRPAGSGAPTDREPASAAPEVPSGAAEPAPAPAPPEAPSDAGEPAAAPDSESSVPVTDDSVSTAASSAAVAQQPPRQQDESEPSPQQPVDPDEQAERLFVQQLGARSVR